jgi:hypothetical protein
MNGAELDLLGKLAELERAEAFERGMTLGNGRHISGPDLRRTHEDQERERQSSEWQYKKKR